VTLIFQELNNCRNLSPLDNLFLGREIRRRGSPLLDYRAMRARATELFRLPRHSHRSRCRPVPALDRGPADDRDRQALLTDVKLLVMDEPTSSLTDKEPTGCSRRSASSSNAAPR